MVMNCVFQFVLNIFPTDCEKGSIGSIDLNIWLAQIAGIPLVGLRAESSRFRAISVLWGIPMLVLVTSCYMFFELYDLMFYCSTLSEFTQNACLSLTHLAGVLKAINVFYRYQKISHVFNEFRSMTQMFIKSEKQRNSFLRSEFENKACLLIYATLVGFTAMLCTCMLIYGQESLAGQSFPFRVKLPSWVPLHVQTFYMALGVSIFAIQIVALDYLNVNMINQIRYQSIALNLAFEEISLIDCSNGFEANERIHIIIEHHTKLIGLRDHIESIFRTPMLLQFFVSVLIMTLSGFQAMVRPEDANGAMLIYFYCGCISCELFFYCWFGNKASEQSETLALSGFGCPWMQQDVRFKKSLKIFLINAQRPIVFTAGGFIDLSLPSFAGILSKAYSSIALLRRFYDN